MSSTLTPSFALLPRIIEAAFAGDRQRLELATLSSIRALKKDAPEIAAELSSILSRYSGATGAMRWKLTEPPPADADGGLALLRLYPTDDAAEPVLPPTTAADATRFLRQRLQMDDLVREGLTPPRTLLLKGAPGTGKTMLAKWLARNMALPLVVLDLATSISSFLGKTGANLRRSLDYARGTPCVILLDEFDAIAKRRDDLGEVGELKRIVNVLLKELEDWPFRSVLIAATNHPELLDPAIHRRFDQVIELPLPGQAEKEKIIASALGRFSTELPEGFGSSVANALHGASGSELHTLAQNAVRQHVIDKAPLARALVAQLASRIAGAPDQVGSLARTLKDTTDLSVREIAEALGKGSSTVQYHLSKKRKETNDGKRTSPAAAG